MVALREMVWDMAIEQFVATHSGVHTSHSTVFSHMILIDGKIQIFNGFKSLAIAIADIMTGFT